MPTYLNITGFFWLDCLLIFAGIASVIGTLWNIREIIAHNKKRTEEPAAQPQPVAEPDVVEKCKPTFQEYGDLSGRVNFQVQVTCSIRLASNGSNEVFQHIPVLLGHGEDYRAVLDRAKEYTDAWIVNNGVNYTPKD